MDIICFGFNSFGQFSEENFTSIRNLLSVTHKQGISAISFSWSKCFILQEDGSITASGFVDRKMFNMKTLQIPYNSRTIKLSSSHGNTLCLTEDGECWKYHRDQWQNITSCLNVNDDNFTKNKPKIIDICSSDTLNFALSDTGLIFNIPIQIETPPMVKITRISCGLEHSLCLTENGSVLTWGSGSRGQLGNGSLNLVENPELLKCLDGIVVIDINAGGWHSAAVTICGDLYTWGWNNHGQLGFRTNIDILQNDDSCTVLAIPRCVEHPDDENIHVKQVSCGTQHTLILLENGLVYGCGWNKYGQVDPTSKKEYFDQMTLVPVPTDVQTIHSVFCEAWNSALHVTLN